MNPRPPGATPIELLTWYFDRINDHEINAARELWTDDTIEYFPDGTCQGADAIAAYFEDKIAAFAGFRFEIVTMAAAGDEVLTHWRLSGTHVGRLSGVNGTGKHISVDGVDHFVMRDGKIATNTVVFDQMQVARAMGVLPANGSGADRAMKGAFNALKRLSRSRY
jgi:steroid delta-isomerase-like uncharacterized protein